MSDAWEIPTKPEIRTNDEEQKILDAWMALGRTRSTRDLRSRVDTVREIPKKVSATEYSYRKGVARGDE